MIIQRPEWREKSEPRPVVVWRLASGPGGGGIAGEPLAWRLGQQRWARTPVSGVLGLNTELDQFEDETGGEESEILIWATFKQLVLEKS